MDGVWLPILEPGDSDIQNAYYNGWKACCNISNVIVWAPDGTIIWARYNCPGSFHDTTVAAPLLELLYDEGRTPKNMKLLADSGFAKVDQVRIHESRMFINPEPMHNEHDTCQCVEI